jgi:hypothetical protein
VKQHTRRLGLRKFATMTDKQINTALKRALRDKRITKIPYDADDQLVLLRDIAVVVNGGYAFYCSKL